MNNSVNLRLSGVLLNDDGLAQAFDEAQAGEWALAVVGTTRDVDDARTAVECYGAVKGEWTEYEAEMVFRHMLAALPLKTFARGLVAALKWWLTDDEGGDEPC